MRGQDHYPNLRYVGLNRSVYSKLFRCKTANHILKGLEHYLKLIWSSGQGPHVKKLKYVFDQRRGVSHVDEKGSNWTKMMDAHGPNQ